MNYPILIELIALEDFDHEEVFPLVFLVAPCHSHLCSSDSCTSVLSSQFTHYSICGRRFSQANTGVQTYTATTHGFSGSTLAYRSYGQRIATRMETTYTHTLPAF